MAEANSMVNLEQLIGDVCTKISTLNKRETDINKNSTSDIDLVEKDVLLRRIRVERRQLQKELSDYSTQKALIDNNVEANDESSDDDDEEQDDDEPEQADILELVEARAAEYSRLNNLLVINKNDIKSRKTKIEQHLKDASSSLLTDTEKKMIDIRIKSQLKSVSELVGSYKNISRDITRICSHDDVEGFHDALSEVYDIANEVQCTYDAHKETERKLNDSTNYNSLKSTNIEKYIPSGPDKFIRYKVFIDEFKEFCLSKPLKPIVKLNHLKTVVGGDALDLIKNFTHGSQLPEALESLENAFSKPEFVVAEIYKTIKAMPTISTFKSIKMAKEQVATMKVALATLKTLGFDDLLGNTSLQTTFILVDLEGKIPIEGYTAWISEKERLKSENKYPNLDTFTRFYEKLVGQQADALYIRKQLEEVNLSSESARRDKKSEQRNTHKHLFKTDVAEKAPDTSTLPQKGKYKNAYCIFENVRGHGSAFCLSHELDFEQKLKKAKAHKVCLVCLRVANHKEKECPNKIKTCMICGQLHNVNIHARRDVIEAFKKKKAEGKLD